MPASLKNFLQRWLVNTFAMLVVVKLVQVRGIHYSSNEDLLVAALTLAFLNAFLRPLLLTFSLPFLILTLGLFTLVINGALLYFVGNLWPGFRVDSFRAAFWGALVISLVSLLVNSLTGSGNARISVHRGQPPQNPPNKNDDDHGSGPVIDV